MDAIAESRDSRVCDSTSGGATINVPPDYDIPNFERWKNRDYNGNFNAYDVCKHMINLRRHSAHAASRATDEYISEYIL